MSMSMKRTATVLLLALLLLILSVVSAASPASSKTFRGINLPPANPYDDSADEEENPGLTGTGRDYDLFDTREKKQESFAKFASASSRRQQAYKAYNPHHHKADGGGNSMFHQVSDWWSTNLPNFPKLIFRVQPTTTLKIRKTFRPLGTIVRMGAEFNTSLGVWQFKSSWEDAIIGGKLTLAGKELQMTKSWQLSMGPVEDLVTRLRFRAAVDLQTMKAYARVGFRTEHLSPINVMEGFTLRKKLPLSGTDGPIKLEVRANVALPEPEIEYSTENQRSLVGMGDIEVNIEELNLLLDY